MGEKRPETGKLILEDIGFFPRFYKLAWCIFKNWHWHQRNYNMVSLAIYHLFPILPQLGEVEMWQVVGRSDGNLMDLLGKLKYQRSRNVIGKLGLEEWEKKAKRINLLKLSFLVHWSWNGLFYTLNWVRWCRQGFTTQQDPFWSNRAGQKTFFPPEYPLLISHYCPALKIRSQMGAKVSSYLQIPKDEFSQGGARTGEKYHRLANSCTRISEYSEKKRTSVCFWQREGSQSWQQQLLQGLDANLSIAERYFPLQRCEALQLIWV